MNRAAPVEPTKPFYYSQEIPTVEKNPEFFNVMESRELQHSLVFLILNEIREYPIINLSDNACRVKLSKLQAYQQMLDFPVALLSKKEDPMRDDSIPEEF